MFSFLEGGRDWLENLGNPTLDYLVGVRQDTLFFLVRQKLSAYVFGEEDRITVLWDEMPVPFCNWFKIAECQTGGRSVSGGTGGYLDSLRCSKCRFQQPGPLPKKKPVLDEDRLES
jgi:hypothetical protein